MLQEIVLGPRTEPPTMGSDAAPEFTGPCPDPRVDHRFWAPQPSPQHCAPSSRPLLVLWVWLPGFLSAGRQHLGFPGTHPRPGLGVRDFCLMTEICSGLNRTWFQQQCPLSSPAAAVTSPSVLPQKRATWFAGQKSPRERGALVPAACGSVRAPAVLSEPRASRPVWKGKPFTSRGEERASPALRRVT